MKVILLIIRVALLMFSAAGSFAGAGGWGAGAVSVLSIGKVLSSISVSYPLGTTHAHAPLCLATEIISNVASITSRSKLFSLLDERPLCSGYTGS